MGTLSLPSISMEAIDYQGRSLLLFDLVAIVEPIRFKSDLTQRDLDNSGISKIVLSRTGMRVTFELNTTDSATDFYAEPPLLDAANPYYKLLADLELDKQCNDIVERHQRTVRLAKTSFGWVDLSHGKVSGLFSALECKVTIPAAALRDPQFATEEVVAAILHELGHLFSYFEVLTYTTSSNVVITTATEALMATDDRVKKMQLITDVFSIIGDVEKETVEAIADSNDSAVIRLSLMRTFEEKEQSRTREFSSEKNAAPYNTRSIEYMADQFAVRHGAAIPLATMQHKLAKLTYPDYDEPRVVFLAFQAIRLSLVITAASVNLAIGGIIATMASLLLTTAAQEDDYRSDPSERLGKIKLDLVQLLKNTKLNSKFRQQILRDVEAIDAIRSQIKEHHGVFRYVWRNFSPIGRRQAKIREFQKGLEDLVNNDLFIHANHLRSRGN